MSSVPTYETSGNVIKMPYLYKSVKDPGLIVGIVLSAVKQNARPALNHRQIAGIIERAGEGLKPLEHLWPVDVSHAQPLCAAV